MNTPTETFISQELIAARAYDIWEQAGRPEGQELEHWFQAESELRQSESSDGENQEFRDREIRDTTVASQSSAPFSSGRSGSSARRIRPRVGSMSAA
jgi:hypothetical protein